MYPHTLLGAEQLEGKGKAHFGGVGHTMCISRGREYTQRPHEVGIDEKTGSEATDRPADRASPGSLPFPLAPYSSKGGESLLALEMYSHVGEMRNTHENLKI